MAAPLVFGDTTSLKSSHAKALAKLGERSVPADSVVSAALARELLELSHELNRRIGLFVNRRGKIERVILGDAHRLHLPEFSRVRGADGRLRGVRLVATHLTAEVLDREELADLSKLKLDLSAALHRGAAGISVDMACLVPNPGADGYSVHSFPRFALSELLREADGVEALARPVPFGDFVREIEAALVSSTARARTEHTGTRALILMSHPGGASLEPRQHELHELCRTAGIGVVDIVLQKRPHPDPRTFLGAGKLDAALVFALEHDVELLICDPDLSASQARTITNATDINVIDRTMLILDIFAQHATSADGKLQVELAQLRHRLPRMLGKGTMMSRLAGGIGGRGPGETKLEVDRRRAKDRITDLERRLDRLEAQRDQKRARRRRRGVPVVAIVGYTNAGKSTLLNTVTNAEVRAENKLFATLDPTVRRLRFPQEREIVLLDTVGLIRDLPPALRQAFRATLEEIADADLLLHVVDASDPDAEQQIETVEGVLDELGAGDLPRFLVFNKCDRLADGVPHASPAGATDQFHISALDRRSTRRLMEAIESRFWSRQPAVGVGPEAR
ncbi:MAG: GTPase HflX [Myxococcales bacterium FL481]|nr:MAG: GTPase HflX [Myxococcales bacterium FL481]